MDQRTYDSRVLMIYLWLLAATRLLSYTDQDWSTWAGMLVITFGAMFRMRSSPDGIGKVLATLGAYSMVSTPVSLVLSHLDFKWAARMSRPREQDRLLLILVPGVCAAFLVSLALLSKFRARDTSVETKTIPEKAAAPATRIEKEQETRRLSLDDESVKEWTRWMERHGHTPLSLAYATLAGAVRALEMGKDHASIEQAAIAVAKAWEAPAHVELRAITRDALVLTEEPWRSLKTGSLSQELVAYAAFLRALELGQDHVTASEAARKKALQWAPPKGATTAANGPHNGGELRGIVYGYMRRSELHSLGPDPLRRGRFRNVNKAVWTFALKREGIGGNGRPLSPIQVRMEGASVTGALEDGDLIELPGTPVAAEVNIFAQVRNLSKGVEIVAAPVQESKEYKKYQSQRIVVPLVIFLAMGVIAFTFFLIIQK
ncbi:MAG: hypothetical protein HOQ35_18095 [Acidobacteriaceae bacterium]|nr:hypothetical protein [Acidobacteriaceae bacterium]